MSTQTSVAALEKTLIIRPRISLWTGRGTFNREDLGKDADKLPPKTLTTDGSITLCRRQTIVKLESLRTAVDREFSNFCVGFMDGFATDDANLAQALAVMDQNRPKFEALKHELLDNFERNVQGWIAENPKWEHLVRKHLPTKAYVEDRVQYRAFMFRAVMASEGGLDAPENQSLAAETSGLSGQLFAEIEKEARTFRDRSLLGRADVTQDAVRPIRRMCKKLRALVYLDRRISPVIEYIELCLDALPKTGRMSGGDLSNLIGIIDFLADSERMKRHGADVIASGRGSMFDALTAPSTPAASQDDDPGAQAKAIPKQAELISAVVEEEGQTDADEAHLVASGAMVEAAIEDLQPNSREPASAEPDAVEGTEAFEDTDPPSVEIPPAPAQDSGWTAGGIAF